MWHYLVFIILTLIFLVHFSLILRSRLIKVARDFDYSKQQFERLSREFEESKIQNLSLSADAQDIIALYDITKEICKTLDEDRVFGTFRELAAGYVQMKGCKFIKEEADLLKYRQESVFPVKLERHSLGYLVAEGLRQEDKDK